MHDATDGYSPRYDRVISCTVTLSIRSNRSSGKANFSTRYVVSSIVNAELRQHQERACD